jgi:hypothetical protein
MGGTGNMECDKGWWWYWREEGSSRGGVRTKEVRVKRGMVVGEEGWFKNFSSKSTYM